MIQLTRLNHQSITINSELIECLECTPDTLIKLTNGESLMVLESVEEVVRRVVEFKRRIFCPAPGPSSMEDGPPACGCEELPLER